MTRSRPRRTASRRPRLGRLLAALTGLILVVAGPPTLLLLLVGNPTDLPRALRSTDALTEPINDQLLLWLLATVGWLLWAHLLGTLAVEALRQIRGSTIRMPLNRLLFGANTALASHLIATLLLSWHPPASSAGALTAAHARIPVAATLNATSASTHHPILLAGGDVQLAALPTAAPPEQPHAGRATEGLIECRVLPPDGRHHDTLWDIAERHLGDGLRWRDIFALNEGRVMPDGQRLTRASLIHPGWILRLPADAISLELDRVPPHPHPTHSAPTTTVPPDPTRQDPEVEREPTSDNTPPARAVPVLPPTLDPPPRPAPTDKAAEEPMAIAGPAGTPAASAAPHGPGTADRNIGQTEDESDSRAPQVALTGGLSLAALGVLAALTRRRKGAARRRPPGTRAATPTPELRATEARLRQDARAAHEVAAAVRLALLLAERHATHTTVKAVWHHPDDSIELVLAQPPHLSQHDENSDESTASPAGSPVPHPFQATPRGWLLPAAGRKYLFATTRTLPIEDRIESELQTRVDPFPLLLPVGTRDGSICLVNLETYGLVSLLTPDHTGQADTATTSGTGTSSAASSAPTSAGSAAPVAAASVIGGWMQQLAGAPWSEMMQIAIPTHYATIAVGLERVDLITPDLLSWLTQRVTTGDPQPLQGHPSLEAARRHDPDGAGIIGTVVLAGLTPDQAPDRLLLAATRPLEPLVMLLLGPHPDAHPWQLHGDGTLSIPGIADDLQPLRLEPAAQDRIARLLEHAQDPPHATPDDPGRITRDTDNRPTPTPIPTPTEVGRAQPDGSGGVDLLGPPCLDLTPYDTARDLVVTADPEGPDRLRDNAFQDSETGASGDEVSAAAGTSRTGLEEPRTDATSPSAGVTGTRSQHEKVEQDGEVLVETMRVDVLGPIRVTGTRRNPRNHLRQLLVYLAVHRRPVLAEPLWEAVFPDRPYDGHILRSRMSDLKQYLRDRLDKHERAWALPTDVLCDWQQFRALADGDPAEQLAALALVRGRPFEDLGADWVHLEGYAAEVEASIVDLALAVSQRALDDGDAQTAGVAALAGLKASPYEERLYQLAMRAASGRGAHHQLRALHRQLRHVLDEELEPDDTEQAATSELVFDLLDAQRPRPT